MTGLNRLAPVAMEFVVHRLRAPRLVGLTHGAVQLGQMISHGCESRRSKPVVTDNR